MNTPSHRRAGKRSRAESGVAALEFALILPALLILILGTVTLAHAFIVRFMISSAAYDAARTCTLGRNATQNCAGGMVVKKLGNTLKWCANNNVSVTATDTPEPGFVAANGVALVSAFEVRVSCDFTGGVGTGFLKSKGIVIASLQARAVMPH